MNAHRDDHSTPHDPEIASLLDREAARLRAEPNAGFEARVLRAAMRAEPERDAPVVIARIGWLRSSAFRAAAAIALLLTVGAVSVVSLRSGSLTGSPSVASAPRADVLDDIDGWLGLDDSVFARTNLASFREELDDASSGISYDDLGDPIIDAEEWM